MEGRNRMANGFIVSLYMNIGTVAALMGAELLTDLSSSSGLGVVR